MTGLPFYPIFSFERGQFSEVVVSGMTAMKTQGQVLQSRAADNQIVTRSLLKPWQVMGTSLFKGHHPMWAMSIASHSGQPIHMDMLVELMAHLNVNENDLICPRSYPMDQSIAAQLRNSGEKPARLQHPCSGKHLIQLASAKSESLPVDTYWNEDHPVQKRIMSLVGKEANEKVSWLTDSCGLPVAIMSVRAILNMYERLALDQNDQAMMIKKLWTENPQLIGGKSRLDTEIIEFGAGRLLAKEGADGLLIVQSLPSDAGSVAGFFVKIASGHQTNHLALALYCELKRRPTLPAVFDELKDFLRSRIEEWAPRDQVLRSLLTSIS